MSAEKRPGMPSEEALAAARARMEANPPPPLPPELVDVIVNVLRPAWRRIDDERAAAERAS